MRNRPSSGVSATLIAHLNHNARQTLYTPYRVTRRPRQVGGRSDDGSDDEWRRRSTSTELGDPVRRARAAVRDGRSAAAASSTLDEPVTLVCAPAGSGKTALVAAQRARTPPGSRSSRPTTSPAACGSAVLTALELAGAVPAGLRAGRARRAGARVARHVHAAAGQRARRRCPSAVVLVLDDVHVLRSARVPDPARVPAPAHARHAAASCSPRARTRACRCTCCACAAASPRSAPTDLAFTEDEAARAARRRTGSTSSPTW